MKKKLLIVPAVALGILAACAQPDPQLQSETSADSNISMESSGNFENVDSSDASSVETQAETAGGFTQLQSVDGTTVTETIGEGDYVLTLDAKVHIPDAPPQEGTFAAKNLDLSAVGDALCNGETLSPESSGTRYTSQDSSISFLLPPGPIGYALFENQNLSSYYSGANPYTKLPDEMTEQENAFVSEMTVAAQESLENIMPVSQLKNTGYQVFEDNDLSYASLSFISEFAGYPLIDASQAAYMVTDVTLGTEGVIRVNFQGFYDMEESVDTDVLSLEEVLEIVRTGVEEKNINTYPIPVTDISLAYMVENVTETSADFYPVWCFSGDVDAAIGHHPLICIDARNGSIVSMFSLY